MIMIILIMILIITVIIIITYYYYHYYYYYNRIYKKFSIMIGSPRAYLSRNRRAITWVSNYRCPFEIFVTGTHNSNTHVIVTSITRTKMSCFAMFPTVFKFMESATMQTFSLKRTSQKKI